MMLFAGLFLFLVSIDMGMKQYIDDTYDLGEERPLGLGPVVLRKVYNNGYLLNFLHEYPQVVKAGSAAAAVVLALYDGKVFLEKGRPLHKLGMTFLSAGAFSNIYDRLFRDYLIDYIGIQREDAKGPELTANLADLYILSGTLLALVTQESPERARKRRTRQLKKDAKKIQKQTIETVKSVVRS